MARQLPSPEQVAEKFAHHLRAVLATPQWNEMRERNARPDYGRNICASHDFCDANMVMDAAFRELGLGFSLDGPQWAEDQELCELWSAAWGIAKQRYLTKTVKAA